MVTLRRFWFFSCWIFHHVCIIWICLLLLSDRITVNSQNSLGNPSFSNQQNPLTTSKSCSSINNEWQIASNHLSKTQPFSQTVNFKSICRAFGQISCCSNSMESEMAGFSSEKLKRALTKYIQPNMEAMNRQKISLPHIISSVLTQTQTNLNDILASAYPKKFSNHKFVITQFFTDLQAYMRGSQNELSSIVDRLLEKLIDAVVIMEDENNGILNPAKSKCVALNLKNLWPYGSTAIDIKVKIKSSFIQTRMLINGLSIGTSVLQELENKISFDDECLVKHSQMEYCHVCAGYGQIRPCFSVCTNVISKCFHQQAFLNQSWYEFIDQLSIVAASLHKNDFSKDTESLVFLISSAVMQLKNSYNRYSKNLHSTCDRIGANGPTRQKRQVGSDTSYNNGQTGYNSINANNVGYGGETSRSSHFFQTILTLRTTLFNYKTIFSNLPMDFCKQPVYGYQSMNTPPCWNGTDITLMGPVFHAVQPLNPSDLTSPVVKNAVSNLNAMINNLKNSFNSDPNYFVWQALVNQKNQSSSKPTDTEQTMERPHVSRKPIPELPDRNPLNSLNTGTPTDQERTGNSDDFGSGGGPIYIPGPNGNRLPPIPDNSNLPPNNYGNNQRPNFGNGQPPWINGNDFNSGNQYPNRLGDPGSGNPPRPPNSFVHPDDEDFGSFDGSGDVVIATTTKKPIITQIPLEKPRPLPPAETRPPIRPQPPIIPIVPFTDKPLPEEKSSVTDEDIWRDAPPEIWIPVPADEVGLYGVSKSQKASSGVSRIVNQSLLTIACFIVTILLKLNLM